MTDRKKKKKQWSPFLLEIQYRIFLIVPTLIRALSLKQAFALARVCAWLFYTFDRKHRKRAIQHILHSGIKTTLPEAQALAKANFLHMLKVFIEVVKFDQIITPENVHEYCRLDPEITPETRELLDIGKEGVQTILATGHIGNWELAGNIYTILTGQTMCSIMRPLANKKIGEYFYNKRMGNRHYTVSKEKGIRPLLTALNKGETVAIVSDQHASHSEGVEVTFFGHPARAHMTPALLHLKTKKPILSCIAVREDDNLHYKLTSTPPIRYQATGNKEHDVREITQLYTNSLEELIRKYPDQWLWAHRRWLDCNRNTSSHKDSDHHEKTGH